MTLHIISTSPFSSHALASCIPLMDKDDALLLLSDGIYSLRTPGLTKLKVFYLEEDLLARGLAKPEHATGIDYPGMVLLTEQHSPIQTWR